MVDRSKAGQLYHPPYHDTDKRHRPVLRTTTAALHRSDDEEGAESVCSLYPTINDIEDAVSGTDDEFESIDWTATTTTSTTNSSSMTNIPLDPSSALRSSSSLTSSSSRTHVDGQESCTNIGNQQEDGNRTSEKHSPRSTGASHTTLLTTPRRQLPPTDPPGVGLTSKDEMLRGLGYGDSFAREDRLPIIAPSDTDRDDVVPPVPHLRSDVDAAAAAAYVAHSARQRRQQFLTQTTLQMPLSPQHDESNDTPQLPQPRPLTPPRHDEGDGTQQPPSPLTPRRVDTHRSQLPLLRNTHQSPPYIEGIENHWMMFRRKAPMGAHSPISPGAFREGGRRDDVEVDEGVGSDAETTHSFGSPSTSSSQPPCLHLPSISTMLVQAQLVRGSEQNESNSLENERDKNSMAGDVENAVGNASSSSIGGSGCSCAQQPCNCHSHTDEHRNPNANDEVGVNQLPPCPPPVDDDGIQRRNLPPVVVATRDTLMLHLKHSRQSQFVVAVFVLIMLGLVFALVLVLADIIVEGFGNEGRGIDGVPTQANVDEIYELVGDSIDGTGDSEFGLAVSMCKNGKRIAVGAPHVTADVGYVRTYDLYDDVWIQVGMDIPIMANAHGDYELDEFLMVRSDVSLSMSADCAVLAIGLPFYNNAGRVDLFVMDGTTNDWQPYGRPILGQNPYDSFGADVALSHDGLRIAVGAPGYDTESHVNAGQVGVFVLTNGRQGEWQSVGSPLDGMLDNQLSGVSVALSATGDAVAFGLMTMGGVSGIAARVCDFFAGEWIDRVGQASAMSRGNDGGAIGQDRGSYDTAWFVQLSADGEIVAVSNYYLDRDGIVNVEANDAIFVMAARYDRDAQVWTQLGSNIHWHSPGPKSGYIIALSDDGIRMAMGDPGRHTNDGAAAGHAHFYQYDNDADTWYQIGPDKYGENGGDGFGYSIALSGDGTRIVTGAPYSRYGGREPHGRVQVYDICSDRDASVQKAGRPDERF